MKPAVPARRTVLGACAALGLCLLTVGCSARFTGFAFTTAEGGRIDLWQPRGLATRSITTYRAPRDSATPLYHLGSAVTAAAGQAFAITYASGVAGATLELYSNQSTVLRKVALPPTSGNPVRFLVALEPGDVVWGFRVVLAAAAAGEITLQGAGTAASVHGFSFANGALTVDGSVEVRADSAGGADIRFPAATRDEMSRGTWLLSVILSPGGRGGTITFSGTGSARRIFALDPAASPGRIDFTPQTTGFLPGEAVIEGPVESALVSAVAADDPLPSDPGLILDAEQSLWRRPEFELYRWSLFPSVLIFDTASYEIQDQLFKRMAYFVEKAGFAGRLLSDEQMRGRHGWNAHDYRAEDLARFFTEAEKEGTALTPLEVSLREILTRNGVIVQATSGYNPGTGAIISISRSSNDALRKLLITHECFHGVYFSMPGFRQATQAVWDSLLPVEKEVWLAFLASQEYDISDNYLVVNEFQSYLLQQERREVPARQALILSRMKAGSARGARLAAELEATAPSSFLKAFDALDDSLQAAGGPAGGVAVAVESVQKHD